MQQRTYKKDPEMAAKKSTIKKTKRDANERILSEIRESMSVEDSRLLDLSMENGASTWLSTLPLVDEGYHLTKQNFWDLIRFRYGWQLSRLPTTCECGSSFSVEHALSCKKGGFISLRHNEILNLTANLLSEICKEVCVEPTLLPLTGEEIDESRLTKDEARSDVCARGFWTSGQLAFLDVRVFNPLAKKFRNTNIQRCYEQNEREKKRQYNTRINDVDHGTFTPLVFSATGGMARECKKFYDRLSELLSEKWNDSYSITCNIIRRKLSFALMKSLIQCIRGSRSVYRSACSSVNFSAASSEHMSKI